MEGYTILLQSFDPTEEVEIEGPGDIQFEWLDKCLIAAHALIQASEDGIERAIVMEWAPDPEFSGGSTSKRQWIFEYDDEPKLRVRENNGGSETWWPSLGELLASLEGAPV